MLQLGFLGLHLSRVGELSPDGVALSESWVVALLGGLGSLSIVDLSGMDSGVDIEESL